METHKSSGFCNCHTVDEFVNICLESCNCMQIASFRKDSRKQSKSRDLDVKESMQAKLMDLLWIGYCRNMEGTLWRT